MTILERATFADGWDGFANFGGGAPIGVTRDVDGAGRSSAKFGWTPASRDVGAQFCYSFTPQDRVRTRFAFKLTSGVSTIWKFCRHREQGFGLLVGGLFVQTGTRILSWGFDAEATNQQTIPVGVRASQVLDGKWHTIEYDYWRNGDPSGFPSAAFWFDGLPVAGPLVAGDAPKSPVRWIDGRLNAGERRSTTKIGLVQMLGTLNANNTTSGECRVTDVSMTQGDAR